MRVVATQPLGTRGFHARDAILRDGGGHVATHDRRTTGTNRPRAAGVVVKPHRAPGRCRTCDLVLRGEGTVARTPDLRVSALGDPRRFARVARAAARRRYGGGRALAM